MSEQEQPETVTFVKRGRIWIQADKRLLEEARRRGLLVAQFTRVPDEQMEPQVGDVYLRVGSGYDTTWYGAYPIPSGYQGLIGRRQTFVEIVGVGNDQVMLKDLHTGRVRGSMAIQELQNPKRYQRSSHVEIQQDWEELALRMAPQQKELEDETRGE